MIKYFANKEDAFENSKYSTKVVDMICPDCGRIHRKQIQLVMANHGLSCSCSDNWSYPNKFIYALLEQLHVNFIAEKSFDWSDKKIYDDYIEYNGLKIITEQHGRQHYDKPIIKSDRFRAVLEEQENDLYKYNLAIQNGIDYYFVIDSRESSQEYMRRSIINSGLLDVLDTEESDVDWDECGEYAEKNLTKTICEYKRNNPHVTLHQIAGLFHIGYSFVLRSIKVGNKLGWCNYVLNDDLKMLNELRIVQRGQKPIFCETNGLYYRTANDAAENLSKNGIPFHARPIRKSISRGSEYKGYRFKFITQEQFNKIKSESPEKVVGDYFFTPN